ncbi:hypothetical protein KK083_13185 [Fulvivirgaceae bacterium PWU4]|uniref:Calx-beta domain-containing protein n=1 Tax=Chryseosolibacter histidini TaxID=2782349 RepID=A0AAP2GPD6_9BACT|nr:Calx-beta domain-containing protein [Chryseosolibacter histidini]MBT1697840.1 hypothetical protein [Chryseosolibacter histidini]
MQKSITYLSSLATVVVLGVALSSCKDDDPPVKPKVSVSAATMTVKESDGTIEVEVSLDKPAPKDISIEYTLDGTAVDKATISGNQAYDYEITEDPGEINIDKGQSKGVIKIDLLSDSFIEDPETIEIQLESATEGIELTRDDEVKITINQEDGLIVALYWPAPTSTAYADMDLLVRIGATVNNWEADIFNGSVQETNSGPEFVFFPKAWGNAAYGMSYTYYDGTLDPLNFTVRFIDLVNGAIEPEAGFQVFTGSYTAANKNKWTDLSTTQVVQTFVTSGGAYSNISPITKPTAGSRMSTARDSKGTMARGSNNYHHGSLVKKLSLK